jgi:hypothetical protein
MNTKGEDVKQRRIASAYRCGIFQENDCLPATSLAIEHCDLDDHQLLITEWRNAAERRLWGGQGEEVSDTEAGCRQSDGDILLVNVIHLQKTQTRKPDESRDAQVGQTMRMLITRPASEWRMIVSLFGKSQALESDCQFEHPRVFIA